MIIMFYTYVFILLKQGEFILLQLWENVNMGSVEFPIW